MEIIEQLVSQLGVSNEQAEGGAGLIFKVAKEQLDSGQFGEVANLIPGLDGLIDKAPAAEAEASTGGGVLGALGGVADAIGMGDIADKLENLAGVAGGFGNLGLDTGMVSKFATAIIEFLKSKGGDQIATILQSVLK
ncbi:MAG: DUF2780 domain-containing protein [Planctomycetota bacterium]